MCLLGRNVKATGECKTSGQLHQKDLKELMLRILSLP
jgi:hypothetical protein